MKILSSAIQSISQNRIRSILAGFGIAWGIFLLVIFLGIGAGFKDGVMKLFNAFAQKSLFVYGGQTSIAGNSLGENTQILFDEGIVDDIKNRYGSVIFCSPEMSLQSESVLHDGETTLASIVGIGENYFEIKMLNVGSGRTINRFDNLKEKNVAVIGEGIKKALFGEQDALGHMINIGDGIFKVIGVLSSEDLFSVQERNSVYIPTGAFINNFNSDSRMPSFCLSLSTDADASIIEKDLKGYLAYRYGFNPNDDQAVYIVNIETQTAAFESLFRGLEVLIWIVGVCLLLSGIVGVCNVMLIIVKERTNEIGIRKAVGATSNSIISMIMMESVTITLIAGTVGVILGALVVLLADWIILPMLNTEIMESVNVNIPAVVATLLILCMSGMAAGLFPALRASQISPVDAIRYENRG